MTAKKISQRLHLWAGLPLGFFMFILCITGCILLFEPEITNAVHADKLRVERPTSLPHQHSLSELSQIAARVLHPGERLRGVILETSGENTVLFTTTAGTGERIAIDPYTARVKGRVGKLPFFVAVRNLHRSLLPTTSTDGYNWGRLVVGISTLAFAVALLSGIIIWWPKTTRGLSKRLKVNTSRGRHRFFSEFHQTGGIFAAVVLLVIAITGLSWSFPRVTEGIFVLTGIRNSTPPQVSIIGEEPEADDAAKTQPSQKHFSTRAWDAAKAEIQRNASQRGVFYKRIEMDESTATAYIDTWGNTYAADYYSFSPSEGRLLTLTSYEHTTTESKVRAWILALHTATWGGWVTKIGALIALIVGCTLPTSGVYLWWKRKKKQAENARRREARNRNR